MNKIKNFLVESKEEFTKVNWPTFEETARYTGFVILLSLGLAAFLGILDFAFLKALKIFII